MFLKIINVSGVCLRFLLYMIVNFDNFPDRKLTVIYMSRDKDTDCMRVDPRREKKKVYGMSRYLVIPL